MPSAPRVRLGVSELLERPPELRGRYPDNDPNDQGNRRDKPPVIDGTNRVGDFLLRVVHHLTSPPFESVDILYHKSYSITT